MRDYPSEYREWLKDKVRHPNYDPWKYNKLFLHLYLKPFTWSIELDEDRAADGIQLRYAFGDDNKIPKKAIKRNLDIFDCSVLEMLIALAMRSSSSITTGMRGYETPSDVFWMFIENLDLDRIIDDEYDDKQEIVNKHLCSWLYRMFDREGYQFNIIRIPDLDKKHDLRRYDFYRQMQLFVASLRNWYRDVDQFGI